MRAKETCMFDFSGKTALITGASGGIGGAIAKALHGRGAKVVLSGTRAEALEAVKRRAGRQCLYRPRQPVRHRIG
jgi:3-oxoacyl-[acyl-carrier protein] reductase